VPVAGIIIWFTVSLFLKERTKFFLYIPGAFHFFSPGDSACESEKITEVAPLLVEHPLSLRLMALVVRGGVVKRTISADVDIPAAAGTYLLPSRCSCIIEFLSAAVALLHRRAP
jgi:hypothetical protein